MNKHVMAMAVCLALQPVIALGAETMIQPGVKERDTKQSFEIQRGQGVPTKPDRSGSGSAQGNVANGCISFREHNPNGVASQEANKPGGVRNDCDPMTAPPALPDGTRLVHTFPDGTRLYATTRHGGIQKYSAIDQRGRALKVEIVQNPPKGMILGPNDAIERGKQRAGKVPERVQADFNQAETLAAKRCIVKILRAAGDIYWDTASSGLGCPYGE
jgi:hypothetical protein